MLCHCSELALEGTILDVIGSDYIVTFKTLKYYYIKS